MKHEPVSRGLEDFLAYLRDAEERHRMAEASRAEADAAEETKTILAEAEQRCQALKQNARTRLDQAAKRIVEGVVKG